jgi:hypothetical protein
MFRAFSVFGGVAATHASEILRECAWPSVCEPVSATRCFMPAQWHSLKNGMVVTMSRTLWLCGEGRMNVLSALCASHRPGRTCRSNEGPPVTSTAAAPAYCSTSAKDTLHWT